MHKLTILFDQPLAWAAFEQGWQKFLGLAEKMPGLMKETVGETEQLVFGRELAHYAKIHELYFESRESLDAALQSEAGQAAGGWLQEFTCGHFTLLIAEHKEANPSEFKQATRGPSISP